LVGGYRLFRLLLDMDSGHFIERWWPANPPTSNRFIVILDELGVVEQRKGNGGKRALAYILKRA
jgi:hypothetical protein